MKVAVITPVYERFAAMQAWVYCNLVAQTHTDTEYYIGDDCSPNWQEAVDRLKGITLDPRLTVFRLKDRKPWSLGDIFNIGAGMSNADLLVFVCADILLMPTAVEQHVGLHTRHPKMLIEGVTQFISNEEEAGLLADPTTIHKVHLVRYNRQPDPCLGDKEVCEHPTCTRCSFLPHGASLPKSYFDKLGGFRPEYAGHYAGFDYDLTRRLQVIGVHTRRSYLPKSIQIWDPCHHKATGRGTETWTDPESARLLNQFMAGLPYNHINKTPVNRQVEVVIRSGTWASN